jgi:polygalacturonase
MSASKEYKTIVKNSVRLLYIFLIISILSFISTGSEINIEKNKTSDVKKSEKNGWEQVPEILKKIVAPKFPDKVFNIIKYGAVADGKTLCTKAFEKAIDACTKKGGGIVEVPKGEYLTGSIHLKNNVNLHISEGAVVKFSTNPKDYLPVVYARWEGVELMNYSPLIYAYEKENIAVTGSGLLDGQADNEHWWNWAGSKRFGWKEGMPSARDSLSRPRLMKLGDDNVPVKERIFGKGYYLRPAFIEFYKSKNILIQGVHLKDSPFWFLHPVLSQNITIDGITTNSVGPNTDGCDPESCTDVWIKNCTFSDGDDCIAIKSGRNNDGRRVNVPSTNFVIQNCNMKDGHGGVVIGSEITGGCWNVFAEDCEMNSPNLDRALRIKSNTKRGGVVRNIYMRNVKIGQVKEAIVKLNMHYDPPEAIGYHYNPVFENIYVQNVTSQKSRYGLFLDGLEDSQIRNIIIEDCKFNGVDRGNYTNYVEGLKLINVYINGELQKDEK